jgi:hypothetical protein
MHNKNTWKLNGSRKEVNINIESVWFRSPELIMF